VTGQQKSPTSVDSNKKVAFAALHHRDYRRYFLVSLFSTMGDNIEHVISYWLLFQKFHSPVLGGFAVISHWTPFLLFAVYFGALADRHDCRRVIQASQFLYATVSLTWAILFLTDTIEVWHACVLLVIHGMAGVLGGPSSQLIIHDIVARVPAERGQTQFHRATAGHSLRSGGWGRNHVAVWRAGRAIHQHLDVPADVGVDVCFSLYRPQSG
jgi:MFS family permease